MLPLLQSLGCCLSLPLPRFPSGNGEEAKIPWDGGLGYMLPAHSPPLHPSMMLPG